MFKNLFKKEPEFTGEKTLDVIIREGQEQWNLETTAPPVEKEPTMKEMFDEVLERLDRIEAKIKEL